MQRVRCMLRRRRFRHAAGDTPAQRRTRSKHKRDADADADAYAHAGTGPDL